MSDTRAIVAGGRASGAESTSTNQKSSIVNIAATLSEVAQRYAEKPAVIVRESATSFSELEAETRRLTAGLRAVGVKRGTRTIVFVPPSVEFFALTFALFSIGAVPVLIDPGIDRKSVV